MVDFPRYKVPEEIQESEHGMVADIVAVCRLCKKEQPAITVALSEFVMWLSGVKIQEALPSLTADQREMLLSGTCEICWEELFGEEEDNDDEQPAF